MNTNPSGFTCLPAAFNVIGVHLCYKSHVQARLALFTSTFSGGGTEENTGRLVAIAEAAAGGAAVAAMGGSGRVMSFLILFVLIFFVFFCPGRRPLRFTGR